MLEFVKELPIVAACFRRDEKLFLLGLVAGGGELSEAAEPGGALVGLPADEELEIRIVSKIGRVSAEAVGVGEDGEVVGVELVAAEGAAGVALEPAVDAVDVESVLALGEEAEDLGVFEFGEADGAFEALAGALQGGEPEEGEGFDDGLVDAGEARSRAGEAVRVAEEVGVVAEEVGGAGVAELGVHEDEEGEGEQDGENSDDDGYARPERIGGVVVIGDIRLLLVRLSFHVQQEQRESNEEEQGEGVKERDPLHLL